MTNPEAEAMSFLALRWPSAEKLTERKPPPETCLGLLAYGLHHFGSDAGDSMRGSVTLDTLDHHATGKRRQPLQASLGFRAPFRGQERIKAKRLFVAESDHLAAELAWLIGTRRIFSEVIARAGISPAAASPANLRELTGPAASSPVGRTEILEDLGLLPDVDERTFPEVPGSHGHGGTWRDVAFGHDPAIGLAGRAAPMRIVLQQRGFGVERVEDPAEKWRALSANDQSSRATGGDSPRIFRLIEGRRSRAGT